jgi:hypothetical protein
MGTLMPDQASRIAGITLAGARFLRLQLQKTYEKGFPLQSDFPQPTPDPDVTRPTRPILEKEEMLVGGFPVTITSGITHFYTDSYEFNFTITMDYFYTWYSVFVKDSLFQLRIIGNKTPWSLAPDLTEITGQLAVYGALHVPVNLKQTVWQCQGTIGSVKLDCGENP